jgi:hypothetical protein
MKNLINTIDLQAKQWNDKVNGNSYFSAQITLNFGQDTQKIICLPFQYGYDSCYEYSALKALENENLIPAGAGSLWSWCRENKVVFNSSKKEKCKKSEVKNFVNN